MPSEPHSCLPTVSLVGIGQYLYWKESNTLQIDKTYYHKSAGVRNTQRKTEANYCLCDCVCGINSKSQVYIKKKKKAVGARNPSHYYRKGQIEVKFWDKLECWVTLNKSELYKRTEVCLYFRCGRTEISIPGQPWLHCHWWSNCPNTHLQYVSKRVKKEKLCIKRNIFL